MPHSGEVALQMPASVDGIVSSAYANSENGSAFSRNAATARCPQVRAPRGSRSRFTVSAAARTAVPNSSLPKVTWNGANPCGADLDQQEAEAPDQGQHGEADAPVERGAATGPGGRGRGRCVDVGAGVGAVGFGVLGRLMDATIPESIS